MRLCPQCESGYRDSELSCPLHDLPMTLTHDLPPGLLVSGAYRILRKLGQGSMGTVYLVEHESAGELMTLKFLNRELSDDDSFTSRFERAAKGSRTCAIRMCSPPETCSAPRMILAVFCHGIC